MHSFQNFIVRLIPNHHPPLETRIWKLVVRALHRTHINIYTPFTRALFVWQFLCDEFYLLVYMRTFARISCGKYICRKTSQPVFMWQTKIVNYEYLFVYMTSHIFVACIYLHVCQALCDFNIVESQNICCIIYTSNSYLSWKIVKQKLLV